MNFSVPLSIKSLISAGIIAFVVAAGSSGVSEAQSRGGGLKVCPEGWRQVTPPLNPLLLCLPNTIVIDTGREDAPPEGVCPEGWSRATPPLNPVLGCLPDNLVQMGPPSRSAPGHNGICPDGWQQSTPPLNPVLGCMPNTFHLVPSREFDGPVAPGFCPDGWRQVSPPLNPVLLCIPDTFTVDLPGRR